jgi:hypothetical protein
MNSFRFMGISVAMVGSFAVAQAQPPGQMYAMSVTLGVGYPTVSSLLAAIPPPPPVNLVPGTTLKLSVGYSGSDLVSVNWIKNNQPLGVTAPELVMPKVTESDSGYYQAIIHRTANGDLMSDTATIRVVVAPRQTLLNLSMRATIGPANPTVICGFVIAPSPVALNERKTLLVRAIGPALAQFGVTHPLAKPVLKIFRSDGTVVDISGPSAGLGDISRIPTIAMRVGAFPLPDVSADIAVLVDLPAGVYSAQISSGVLGESGELLFEVYEVPDQALEIGSNFPT